VTDPVEIGTAIVAYIEPHAGLAREFNRWYERDHFYAAALAGPGMFAGARWVATRACKEVRPPVSGFGDPRHGSYLATYWLLPGMQAEWEAWTAKQMSTLPPERLFPGRDHLHTARYEVAFDLRSDGAPPPATALDHGFAGVVAIAAEDPHLAALGLLGDDIPLVVGLRRDRVILATTEPPDHVLMLAFCNGDVVETWKTRVAHRLDYVPGLLFASPFLRTVPGTDRYVDEL
jgi:hypothetical protein